MNSPSQMESPTDAAEPAGVLLDFDSDEPLPVCPMRKDGLGDGEICEACQ